MVEGVYLAAGEQTKFCKRANNNTFQPKCSGSNDFSTHHSTIHSVSVRDRASWHCGACAVCVHDVLSMLAERLVVWMHYQLPHTSLNAGLWGGRGDGVYLENGGQDQIFNKGIHQCH